MKRFCFLIIFVAFSIFLTKGYAYGNLISLTATTIQMDKSTTYNIDIIGKKTGLSYVWTTSNNNVVKVNAKNGKISAVNEGEAFVTCSISGLGRDKQNLRCKVIVGEDAEGPRLTKENLNLKVGEQFDINISKKIANSKYRWISSNQAVLKINTSNGVVIATGKGEAEVTCTITAPDKHIIVLRCRINVAEEASNIIWKDEFISSTILSNNWGYEYGYVRNSELQDYTDRTDNAFIRDGKLVIKAIKDTNGKWTSASILTNNKFEVGNARIEARIKLPKESGAFPAFWLLGADYEVDYINQRGLGDSWLEAREIDIVESFGKAMNVQGGVFLKSTSSATALSHYFSVSKDIDITQFNTYAIEKSDVALKFYCNDNLYYSYDIKDDGLKEPFYILLNLAVGAAGGIPDQTNSEMEMVVDYVRVTTLDDLPATVPESIKLDTEALYGKVRDIKKINFELLPLISQNRTVTWKSSNTEVATVYGGYVHMKKTGICTITATTYNGLTVTCKVICN
ncbi:MAG: family 16 glycosylhydrolase [Mobilitalea sp.]